MSLMLQHDILMLHHIGVFSTADGGVGWGGWVGPGVPSSFCSQSPKTDCGRKAFSQYCRQRVKRRTKAGGIKILTELGSGAAKALIFDDTKYLPPLLLFPELKSFGNFLGEIFVSVISPPGH